MKIRTKILLFIILPIFLINLAITAFNAVSNFDSQRMLSEAKFVAETEFIAAKISAENARGVAVSKTAAVAGEILFGNRPESVRLVREVLAEFPSYIGASVGYEVNADLSDFKTELGLKNLRDGKEVSVNGGVDAYDFVRNKTTTTMDEWIARSEGGRFIAYWTRAKGDLTLEPLVGMDASMYSAGLRKKVESGDKEAFIVTEPYLYNNKVMMVEFSAPIFADGKFSGQIAFDRDLSAISALVNSVKTLSGEDIFLVSSQGRIISATRSDNLRTLSVDDLLTDENGNFTLGLTRDDAGQLARDETSPSNKDVSKFRTTYRDMLRSAAETAKNSAVIENIDKKVSYYRDPQDGNSYCVAQSLIRPGGWIVVRLVPEIELLSHSYAVLYRELAGLGVFLITMVGTLLLANGMLSRVASATRIAEEISKGNLNLDIAHAEGSSDETGRLTKSVHKMAAKLRGFVLQTKDLSRTLSRATSSIETACDNCDGAMRSIDAGADSILSTVRQAGDAAQELCSSADRLSESASDSALMAGEGKKRIAEMENAMGLFSRSTEAVARRLSIISERAANINEVVTTISKVADETNLLSLNASIEAQKAGGYGVGFAVVAREIGRLAEQTAMAADDIETIVKDMQSAVLSGVSEMDKFSEEIKTGGSDIGRIISDMDEIVSKMQSISPQVEKLSAGMQGQRADLTRLGDAVAGLNDNIRHAAVLMKEFSAARAQLKTSVEKLSKESNSFDTGNAQSR